MPEQTRPSDAGHPPAPVPDTRSLRRLRTAVADCQACDLYEHATQSVFGAGPRTARVMMIGEQPGDVEDKRGAPFVGPAGKLLDRAIVEAGLDRDEIYVTNAVKHFKFHRVEGGKRRIHEKPAAAELAACRPWLRAELTAVRPEVVVVLGATAATATLGRSFRVTKERGRPLRPEDLSGRAPLAPDAVIVATVHPSSVLRSREREKSFAALVADLQVVAGL